jgi:hypothetical protein
MKNEGDFLFFLLKVVDEIKEDPLQYSPAIFDV